MKLNAKFRTAAVQIIEKSPVNANNEIYEQKLLYDFQRKILLFILS